MKNKIQHIKQDIRFELKETKKLLTEQKRDNNYMGMVVTQARIDCLEMVYQIIDGYDRDELKLYQ